jgi:hypothetical protein
MAKQNSPVLDATVATFDKHIDEILRQLELEGIPNPEPTFGQKVGKVISSPYGRVAYAAASFLVGVGLTLCIYKLSLDKGRAQGRAETTTAQ